MQTQVMPERALGLPWLEYTAAGAGPPQRIPLESFPFTIGRGESADFRVDSGRVSREHAVILLDGTAYRVQDLQSTNGTSVNGSRVDEALLGDGDVLLLADVELTFCLGEAQDARTRCTRVMDAPDAKSGHSEADLPQAILRGVRRLQEMLVQCAIATTFQPIVALEGGELLGYEALHEGAAADVDPPAEERGLLITECRLTARIRQLRRTLAAEEAVRFPADAAVFLKLDGSEIGAHGLIDSLAGLRDTLGDSHPLVIEVPDSAVSDAAYARELRRRLRELAIGLAYDGFAAGATQHLEHEEFRPDYLKLAPSLVRGVHCHRERQRQVRAVAKAGRECDCRLVAVGIQTADEAETCRELGCEFGQGDHFGRPQAAHLWPRATHP